MFTNPTLFVCTYVAKLDNINIPFETLTHKLCKNLSGSVLAINSNFGHAAQPGYENHIKPPKIPSTKPSIYIKGKIRKVQGDGTCFNSAIEPVIKLPNSAEGKYYYIKCFPTTGETQIPGVIREDFSDGHDVLVEFINYLNNLNIGTDNKLITIHSESPKMINYKFILNKTDQNMLINLYKLFNYFQILGELQKESPDYNLINMDGWKIITIPYIIREIKSPINDIKFTFRMLTSEKKNRSRRS